MSYGDFNSIKVQLELVAKPAAEILPIFQFHKGTIRTGKQAGFTQAQINFNSIKVQLERHIGDIGHHRLFHFNSIKVQLELKICSGLF